MNQEKKKLPNSYHLFFPFLLCIASLIMGFGYAAINSVTTEIRGTILANNQEGIFITEVSQSTNSSESIINSYRQKLLSTKIVLDKDNPVSYVTYNVTVYNNTSDSYIFTGSTFEKQLYVDENNQYNTDINYEVTKLNEILLPHEEFNFQIKFYYNNNTPVQNILNSYITFLFEKVHYITYVNELDRNYPTFIANDETLRIDMSNSAFSSAIVKIDNVKITDYTFENKILIVPNVSGDVNIEFLTRKALITFDTNMNVSQYESTIGFNIEKRTEADGEYYRASFNKRRGTYDEWYRIEFPTYEYKVGSTYRIRAKTRVQEAVLDFAELRHAAIDNDWGTEGREYVQFTYDEKGKWFEQTITRTFNSETTTQGGQRYNLEPRVEIYTSNLTLAGGINSRKLTFDYKDIYVGEITTKSIDYGTKLGTLETPTREGYRFKGWYTEPENGTMVNSSTIVNSDEITYYAHWISNDTTIYNITYTNADENDYPTFVEENETLVVDMSDSNYFSVSVEINGNKTSDYTYENSILTIPNINGNVNVIIKRVAGFADKILENNTLIIANPTLTMASVNTTDASGLYKSTDTNSGDATYYFRGNVENNYVSFAGQTWRVVRINEDGTVRIVMSKGINNRGYNFNSTSNGVGQMYFTNTNVSNSAKYELDAWYEQNLSNYSNIIASGNYYCEQAKVKLTPGLSSGDATMELSSNYKVDFKCSTDGNGYGLVNSNIGLLTYDEIVHAGGYSGQANNKYYLYINSNTWTMSAAGVNGGGGAYEWFIDASGNINYVIVNDGFNLRPVINLNENAVVTGSGTSTDPYIIEN